MQKEIIIAGFGGQGVLFGGQVIAYAAMDTGKEVTWIPSYSPEMRGGTANEAIAERARQQLNMVREGEVLFQFIGRPAADVRGAPR